MVDFLESVVVIVAGLVTILANGDQAIVNGKRILNWISGKISHNDKERDK